MNVRQLQKLNGQGPREGKEHVEHSKSKVAVDELVALQHEMGCQSGWGEWEIMFGNTDHESGKDGDGEVGPFEVGEENRYDDGQGYCHQL